ncbi:amino acid transporter [Actinomycetospora sp. NBRC 106375]|uniref:APC family permease n=1 Tax=Actinomycetospora sp. NBRC 106375 TaxID=3032207 RepID=UPI0024A28CC0|nr:APC family permease [Actinomycetospora sp. NBRC 106375]GLZ44557.1 amino acid transporter [Actinomycetospora sp. NBRC 106375]
MAAPPEPTASAPASPTRLSGRLGVGSIVFMVVAAAAPLTVIAGTIPLGVGAGNGAAFPATFVLCAVVLLLFAVGFCAMSPHVPDAGAFFTYVRAGLGRPLGLGTAFLALATYTAVQAAVYGYIGAAIDELVTSFGGPSLPWFVWTFVVMAIVGVLGYRHIELSSRVLGVLLIAEIAIVVVLDVVVVVASGAQGLSTAALQPAQIGSGAVGIAIMFAIASFIGFESTAVFRDEARDPHRTIPRATYVALAVIGVFYAVSSWAVVSAWGDQAAVEQAAADPATFLLRTFENWLGPVGLHIVTVLLVTSLFAAILAFHNVAARYWFALGGHRAFPAACARTHERHGSPHVASLSQTALSFVLIAIFAVAGLDPVAQVFAWMGGTATVGVLGLMTLTCLAVLVFFARNRVDRRVWNTRIAPALGLVGLLVCLVLTLGNFTTLLGGSAGLAYAICGVLVVVTLVGVVMGAVRRRPLPDLT